jgi:hypothetical protein
MQASIRNILILLFAALYSFGCKNEPAQQPIRVTGGTTGTDCDPDFAEFQKIGRIFLGSLFLFKVIHYLLAGTCLGRSTAVSTVPFYRVIKRSNTNLITRPSYALVNNQNEFSDY